jgi:predicted metalloprotease
VGSGADDPRAHGNAFDRVSAFQDGYASGAGLCAAMTVQNRVFTQTAFGSAEDAAREGNLPLPELLNSLSQDAQQRFGAIVGSMGGSYPPLEVTDAATRCPTADVDRQGPVRYCPDDQTIAVDGPELEKLHVLGDFASGALVLSRYALAALAALDKPTEGTEAGRQALCLTGVYTAQLFNAGSRGEFQLSPGDLDEAVTVLLATDFPARDVRGQAKSEAGFERVTHFRTGALNGTAACRI